MAPWDQQPGEPDESYVRFLSYRNLGFKRSLRRAYHRYLQAHDGFTGGHGRLHLPGTWSADSSVWDWVARAAAWDLHNLTAYGGRLAVLHVQAVTEIAKKNARAARRLNPGDDGWAELCQSVRLVAEYLTPEVVRALQDRGTGRHPVRQPAAAGDDPDR